VPAGVDVYPRTGPHGNVYIMVNFAKTAQTVSLPTAMQDVLKGGTTRTLTLPHYGVSVVSAAR
jgi:beta-galactosidase